MTDHAGLIERLQDGPPRDYDIAGQVRGFRALADEAASAIASLVKERDEAREDADTYKQAMKAYFAEKLVAEARCARLEEALRPFAAIAEEINSIQADTDRPGRWAIPLVGDFRRARQALEEQG